MTSTPSITPRKARDGQAQQRAAGSHAARTRGLLACGAVAGPLFVIVVVARATGLLLIAAAVGLRRALQDGRGSLWAPRLLMVTAGGLIGGGLFHPDPSTGYPPGTPADASAVSSWHGMLHQVCGSAAFLALIAFCIVFARRYRAQGQRPMAACSLLAGVLCLAGVASGGLPHGALTLFIGVSVALLWTAFTATQVIRNRTSA